MYKNILVSIGIPVVKSTFLSKAMDSCLKQTYQNIEIIIVNNAADNFAKVEIKKIVENYSDNRIKYFENDIQLPIIENWNKVLEYIEGEFFSLLCDDDKWEPTFIEKMLDLSDKYPESSIFHSRVLIVDANENPLFLSPLCNEYEDGIDFIYHRLKGWRYQFLSDFLMRADKLKMIGGFTEMPDGWGSDDITWFKIAIPGGIAYDSRPLFIYRDHVENITNSKKWGNKIKSIPKYIQHVQEIISTIPESSMLDSLRKRMIEKELQEYKKRNHISFTVKRLMSNKFIPNQIVPVIMIFYKRYKFFFGW